MVLTGEDIGKDNHFPVEELIPPILSGLSLDLSGLNVLTEAATGNYVFTPVIAAMAGAERVIAKAKDSRHGSFEEARDHTMDIARRLSVSDSIEVKREVSESDIHESDIITNLGHIRPIDAALIDKMGGTAVVPLMFETWEFREEDLDLKRCYEKGVPVLGTNEEHPKLRILDYNGPLCLKKLYEAGVNAEDAKVMVIGENRFSDPIESTLAKEGADIIKSAGDDSLRGCDAIIVNTYPSTQPAIGAKAALTPEEIKAQAPECVIIQYTGRVDRGGLREAGIRLLPGEEPAFGHMSWTLAELGPKPVIKLHAGGLKVGEVMTREKRQTTSIKEAIRNSLKKPICQDFSEEQKIKYSIHK
ncbi:MAG: hypothetical protein GF416_00315 [Candidatus Altiarchaeales archaeon]|nr:hypothetical protein [Candidatus Altiarchaeales archaeon]MBD3415563.1 hypothetical protein [Candidatus Altiarchaeales archaeon]